jgi:uncharacterized protein with FMN-binding domain
VGPAITPFVATGIAQAAPAHAKKITAKKPAAKTPAPAKTVKITGSPVTMQWGTVQVTMTVKAKKILQIQATAPTERARSAYINGIAVPMLVKEVLKAQNANIYLISGATMTSEAFVMSLQAALKSAHL